MIPISDVIPTRTSPVLTIALIAASVLFASLLQVGGTVSLVASLAALWLFGWTLEDRLGHLRFGVLFCLCAAIAWMLGRPPAMVSGGVAGVLGGYFVLYPRSLMLVAVPLPSPLREVPAVTLLALWLLSQLLLGPFPFVPQLVGCFAGALLTVLLKRPERLEVDWWSPQKQATGFEGHVSADFHRPTARTSA
jgi:membrane associated rhomboid family serine protease